MPKIERLRPFGVMVDKLSLYLRDAGSDPVGVNIHNSCARSDPLTSRFDYSSEDL